MQPRVSRCLPPPIIPRPPHHLGGSGPQHRDKNILGRKKPAISPTGYAAVSRDQYAVPLPMPPPGATPPPPMEGVGERVHAPLPQQTNPTLDLCWGGRGLIEINIHLLFISHNTTDKRFHRYGGPHDLDGGMKGSQDTGKGPTNTTHPPPPQPLPQALPGPPIQYLKSVIYPEQNFNTTQNYSLFVAGSAEWFPFRSVPSGRPLFFWARNKMRVRTSFEIPTAR